MCYNITSYDTFPIAEKENNMNDQFERFNKRLPPKKCKWFLKPIVWLLAFSGTWKHRTKIEKINMKGVKPPYVLLGITVL